MADDLDLDRVKRNVAKMVSQGAPERDIDAYISGEGTTVDAVKAYKAPTQPYSDVGEVMAPFAGFNRGVDALINLPGAAWNLGSRALGYGDTYQPMEIASRANVGYEPQTLAGRTGETIGEVAGASVIPEAGMLAKAGQVAKLTPQARAAAAPIFERMAAEGPVETVKKAIAPTIGAGVGTQVAREKHLGPVPEMIGGLMGGFAAPNVVNIGARAAALGKGVKAYAGRQMARAGNPELAADQDTVDALLKAGIQPEELLKEFAPSPSGQLAVRGITDEQLAGAVARVKGGEPIEPIAAELKISPGTLGKYLRYMEANPTPRNVADVVQDLTDVGKASPVLRLGRTAFGIADEGNAASALTTRQVDQYGRMVNILRRAAKGRDYDQTIADLDETLGQKSRQAYALAHENEQPFDLTPALRTAREVANNSAGDIRTALDKAADLFFEPVAQPKRITAMEDVRMAEMRERIEAAKAAENPDPVKIAKLERRFDAMRDDAEYNANAKPVVTKIGKPIGDVPRYQAAREALDQMIDASKNAQGKATPLTRKLTIFRNSINEVMRESNPLMAAADDQFAGAKATQRLLQRGEDLTTQLGSKTDEFFKDFNNLSPEQREIVRLAFLRKLQNQAARPQEGAALANQFRSEAVRQTIQRLFGPEPIRKGMTADEIKALKARNKENLALGNDLIKAGRREATTTNTLNYITARGNSPTAPWQRDMQQAQEGAEFVGEALTGNVPGLMKRFGRKLAAQMGERRSKIILDNLTNTQPEDVIPKIQRWIQIAKSAGERQDYVLAMREYKRAMREPGVDIGTISRANAPDHSQ